MRLQQFDDVLSRLCGDDTILIVILGTNHTSTIVPADNRQVKPVARGDKPRAQGTNSHEEDSIAKMGAAIRGDCGYNPAMTFGSGQLQDHSLQPDNRLIGSTGILPVSPAGVSPVGGTSSWQGQDGPATHGQDAHATTSHLLTHPLTIRDCGAAEYRGVLELQGLLQERRRAGEIGDTVLIVEHPAVITLGARKTANRLLVDAAELARRGIDVVEIRRGGGATAHNPGQLVFYPIVHLQELRLGVNEYVRTLEAIGIKLLAGLGVESGRRKGYPGLWVSERKIASVGVRVSRFVTCHGMAINIQNDLSIFNFMVPCGLDGVVMTSAQKETGRTYDMGQVKEQLAGLLHQYLGHASQGGHP